MQIHPSALQHGGLPLIALCLTAAQQGKMPMAVHLDHGSAAADIQSALAAGVSSVMADGSQLAYADNIAFTREMTTLTHAQEISVEAELGRLTGTEDGLTVPGYEAKFKVTKVNNRITLPIEKKPCSSTRCALCAENNLHECVQGAVLNSLTEAKTVNGGWEHRLELL